MTALIFAALLSTMPMEITAYHWTGNRTASGVWPREGMVACARRWDFGTQFHIPGVGVVECQDRGGAITRGKLDLFVATRSEAIAWGRRMLRVRVLDARTKPVSGHLRADPDSDGSGEADRKFTGRNDLARGTR